MRLLSKTNLNFIAKQKIAALLSMIFVIAGIGSLISKEGPKLSIDFTGGTVAQLKFNSDIQINQLRTSLIEFGFEGAEIVEFGSSNEILIKTQLSGSTDDIFQKLKASLGDTFVLRRVESVGPKIGKELQTDAIKAIGLALLLIVIYIALRFDRYYALGSVVALIHDVLITLGVFSLFDYEINLSIVAAVLTIVGYSMNDTVVIFDRIRENLRKYENIHIKDISDTSINETLSRTIITSLTTLLALLSIYLFGGEILKGFSFAMIL